MNLAKKIRNCLGSMVLALGITSAADAAVIYNNFGPGDSFQEGIGYTIDGAFSQGVGFIAGQTGVMTSVDVGMGVAGTPPKVVNFTLYADNGANNTGAILETFSITISNLFGTEVVSSGATAGSTVLTAGLKYWLIAASADGTTNIPWGYSDSDVGDRWINGNVSVSTELAAFRINADSQQVPEPGVAALLAVALLGAGMARRQPVA